MRFLSIIALLVLLGCASNKPTAKMGDDPRCKAFYEVIESIAKKDKLAITKILGFHKMPILQGEDKNNLERICIETILCNKTEYCAVAMTLPDSLEMNFLQPRY